MLNIAVLVSGGGTNLGALIDAQREGRLGGGRIRCVISSRPGAYALTRAKNAGIPAEVADRRAFDSGEAFDKALKALLKQYETDIIVLAGFMSILGDELVGEYKNRIINVHPSLIPAFCGKGFYGLRVHEAALDSGVKLSGATVHFVNEVPDGGAIILQKAVEVKDGDTPESLQKRIMEQAEWRILPEAVALFCEGKIKIENGKAIIIK
ncbi:MAG TPA: phosphoribosylglycinamide formyltransferase [Ruminococcaceae bacterium]|nr:phosphoribosylglycinamide formyltransferase [Oscillospiraceae bacterium]